MCFVDPACNRTVHKKSDTPGLTLSVSHFNFDCLRDFLFSELLFQKAGLFAKRENKGTILAANRDTKEKDFKPAGAMFAEQRGRAGFRPPIECLERNWLCRRFCVSTMISEAKADLPFLVVP